MDVVAAVGNQTSAFEPIMQGLLDMSHKVWLVLECSLVLCANRGGPRQGPASVAELVNSQTHSTRTHARICLFYCTSTNTHNPKLVPPLVELNRGKQTYIKDLNHRLFLGCQSTFSSPLRFLEESRHYGEN